MNDRERQELDAAAEFAARDLEQRYHLVGQADYGPEQQKQLRDYARRQLLYNMKLKTYFSGLNGKPAADGAAITASGPIEPDFLHRAMDREAADRAADAADEARRPQIGGISREQAQANEDRYILSTYGRNGKVTPEQTTAYHQALDRQSWRDREAAMSSSGDGYWNRFVGNLSFMANPANDGEGTFNDVLTPVAGLAPSAGGSGTGRGALGARRRPPRDGKSGSGPEPIQPAPNVGKQAPVGPPSPRGASQTNAPTRPDPNWRSTQTGTTSGNSKILRKNLGIADGSGLDAHHIVASTEERARPAQDLLDKYQIDINDRENGVPIRPTGEKPAHHGHGLHSQRGMDKVHQRLKAAAESGRSWGESRQKTLNELSKIRSEIESGEFP